MTRLILTAVVALLTVGALYLLMYVTGMAIGVAFIGALIIAAIVGAIWLSLKSSRSRANRTR